MGIIVVTTLRDIERVKCKNLYYSLEIVTDIEKDLIIESSHCHHHHFTFIIMPILLIATTTMFFKVAKQFFLCIILSNFYFLFILKQVLNLQLYIKKI
jgi:hypothetical protein